MSNPGFNDGWFDKENKNFVGESKKRYQSNPRSENGNNDKEKFENIKQKVTMNLDSLKKELKLSMTTGVNKMVNRQGFGDNDSECMTSNIINAADGKM